jgi:hypothetical protein
MHRARGYFNPTLRPEVYASGQASGRNVELTVAGVVGSLSKALETTSTDESPRHRHLRQQCRSRPQGHSEVHSIGQ